MVEQQPDRRSHICCLCLCLQATAEQFYHQTQSSVAQRLQLQQDRVALNFGSKVADLGAPGKSDQRTTMAPSGGRLQ